jgi:predicted nucleic acid-binding protein
MIGFNKIFLDTSLFIYLLETGGDYGEMVSIFIEYCTSHGISLVTSTVTHTEFCVKPYREGNRETITGFSDLLAELKVHLQNITLPVADTAAKLRSKYHGLKALDALQIAAAIYSGCDRVVTNDKQLKQIEEIRVMLIGEWSH